MSIMSALLVAISLGWRKLKGSQDAYSSGYALTKRNPRRDGPLSERRYPLPCQECKPSRCWRRTSVMGQGEGRGASHVLTRVRTIIADTLVSPTSTIEPAFCAAAEEASPRASKERLEYMAWYSEARIKREDRKVKGTRGSSRDGGEVYV